MSNQVSGSTSWCLFNENSDIYKIYIWFSKICNMEKKHEDIKSLKNLVIAIKRRGEHFRLIGSSIDQIHLYVCSQLIKVTFMIWHHCNQTKYGAMKFSKIVLYYNNNFDNFEPDLIILSANNVLSVYHICVCYNNTWF